MSRKFVDDEGSYWDISDSGHFRNHPYHHKDSKPTIRTFFVSNFNHSRHDPHNNKDSNPIICTFLRTDFTPAIIPHNQIFQSHDPYYCERTSNTPPRWASPSSPKYLNSSHQVSIVLNILKNLILQILHELIMSELGKQFTEQAASPW